MHPDKVDKLNGYGVMWRVIQPFILGGYLTLIMINLSQMKDNFNDKCLEIKQDITEIKLDVKEHKVWGEGILSFYQGEWKEIRERIHNIEIVSYGYQDSLKGKNRMIDGKSPER